MNNPVMYQDPSGEVVITTLVICVVVGVIVGGTVGGIVGNNVANKNGATGWDKAGYIAGGATIGAVGGGVLGAVAAPAIVGVTGVAGVSVTSAGISTVAVGSTAVIGSFPGYVAKANEVGARFFQVPINTWNKMTSAEQWRANKAFLDTAISKGSVFLVEAASAIKDGSYLQKEINYLLQNGYQWLDDLSALVKVIE